MGISLLSATWLFWPHVYHLLPISWPHIPVGVFLLLKAKSDHLHHACTDGFSPTWWRWSRLAFSLLTAYQILSADFIAKGAWQSCISKLQYNICRRRTRFSLLFAACILWPHVYHLSVWVWPHVLVGVFLLCSRCNHSLPAEQISSASTAQKLWPHINHSALGFDHIFDHKQNRSTRRQECTRVWKSRFCVAERARKSKNG